MAFSPTYTIEVISRLILDVVPAEATWLGWSLGGMIAWWIALQYPKRVKKLITVASSPKFEAGVNWPGVDPATLVHFAQALKTAPQKTMQDFLELQLRGSSLTPQTLEDHISRNNDTPSMATFENSLELLKTLDLRNDLQKLKCPSLHIFGSHDTLVPKSLVTILQSLLPASSRCEIFQRTGHIPFLTHPTLFLNQLLF